MPLSLPNIRELFDRHFETRSRLPLRSPKLEHLSGNVLHIGCGTYETDVLLAEIGAQVTSWEWSRRAMERTPARANAGPEARSRVTTIEATGDELPFASSSFDSVLLTDTLEFVAHPTTLLKHIARVLKPGGTLQALVPMDDSNSSAPQTCSFSSASLTQLLEHYFEQVEVCADDAARLWCARCRNLESVRLPRIICMMRIRDEGRWIQQVLDSIAPVCDGIVIVDDGSVDVTPEICRAHPAVVDYYWQNEPEQDQVRDKTRLLKMAIANRPEWILCMDGDEVLEDSAPERIFDAIRRAPPEVTVLDIEFLYMWDDERHYRTDGPYQRIFHHRLFTLAGQDAANLRYFPTRFKGGGHLDSVPGNIRGQSQEIDVKVKHLGYMPRENRKIRYERYRRRDPEDFARGAYDHLLDQPNMIILEWRERPFRKRLSPGGEDRYSTSNLKQERKPEYYYSQARKNLADLVPQGTRRLLDVGCGSGATGGLIRSRGLEVVGIELHAAVAEQARKSLSQVLVGDVETMELPFAEGWFDCILLGDVLEHLINPWETLRRLMYYLAPHGTVIASLPNVRNLGVIRSLYEGGWRYEEQGILDKTHLRFFAKRQMLALFEQAGLTMRVAEVVRDPLFETQMKSAPLSPVDVEVGNLTLRRVSPEDLDELTAQQFIFVGTRREAHKTSPAARDESRVPTVSVIIPAFNNLKYTRQCITSLFTAKETTDFEVIVVDNGSTDGTAEYLRQLPPPVRTVSLPENLGFAKGCNHGAAAACGEYLVFLNNDTMVLPDWLSAMLRCLQSDPTIGLVGNLQIFPDSNRVQQAGIVCGENHIVRSIYSNELPADHPVVNKPREFQFVAGSCMMIEREFFHALGGFDEAYLNSCEDIDLCMKVRAAGRRVFYCPASRIYHYESRTVTGHSKDGDNYRRFVERWRDRLIRDDLKYLEEDGFLPATPSSTTGATLPMETGEHTSLRVAILSTYNQHCGLATYVEFLVSALEKSGLEPLILAEAGVPLRGPDSPRTIRCWTRADDGGREIPELLRRQGIRVLHVNHGGIFSLDGWLPMVLRAARNMGIRVVTTFHSTETVSDRLGELCQLSDRVLVHQAQNELELIAVGAPPDRIEVVPHGMPAVEVTDIFESKLALGWDPATKMVGSFGFVEPHKGTHGLIEAMKSIHERTGAHLRVFGGAHPTNPESQRYLALCKQRALELGLGRVVHFSEGFVPDDQVARYLRACDVIVLNYQHQRFENSGAAMLALSSGRPLVATAVPSFEWASQVAFKVTTRFTLEEAVCRVLENPFIGRRLLDHTLAYEKEARWDVIAKRVHQIYTDAVSTPPRDEISLMQFYRSHPDDIYAEPLQRERVRWLKSKAAGKILEVGPANGYVSQFVGGSAAVDINRGRLAVAAALRPSVTFQYGNVVEGLPFADKQFDQVMAPEILEHVEFEEAVTALKECLRVGRRVLLTLPNADKPNYDPDLVHNIEHRWLVNRNAVDRLLREAGCAEYDIETSEGQDFYLVDICADSSQPRAVIPRRTLSLPPLTIVSGKSLHVGLDASALEDASSRNRGIGRYLMGQFDELINVRPAWNFTLLGTAPNPVVADVMHLAERCGDYRCWSELTSDSLPEVVYLPNPMGSVGGQIAKAFMQTPVFLACTFHDLIPLVFPNAYLNPDPKEKAAYLQRLAVLRERCDLFFCNSQFTAQDLQKYLQIPLARLRIVHAGVPAHFAETPEAMARTSLMTRLGLEAKRFLLFVGVPDYRKNAAPMLFALSAARRVLNEDLHLVIAGDVPPHLIQLLERTAQDCSLPKSALHITGFVSEPELSALYHSALALLFPSMYEGFGFPIVEAMAAGLPVIAGNNSSQPEIAGDAALLVDVLSTEAIAGAIVMLCESEALREELIKKGLKQYRRFTWRRVAEKTAIYLEEAVARKQMTKAKKDSYAASQGVPKWCKRVRIG